MEKKIIDALDSLDINETERLLESQEGRNIAAGKELNAEPGMNAEQGIGTNLDKETQERIKALVYRKAGLDREGRKNGLFRRRLITTAAAAVLVFTVLLALNNGNVSAAFQKLFSFVPGYGIVENNESIDYIIDGQDIKAEDNDVIIHVRNAVATKNGITAFLELERKNYDESKLVEQKQKEWEDLHKGGKLKLPEILLYAGDKAYKSESMSIGGGGRIDIITVDFKLNSTDINTKTIYRIKYGDYDLQTEFKLKSYASFDTLEEIGPTETHNDISITAVAERKDGKLEVQLYPINKSGYNIKAYTKEYGKGYGGKDLSIETSNEIKTYIAPGSYTSPNSRFTFDVSQDEKDMILKIPYLIVQSNESKNIALKIPKSGEKLQLNERVEFKESTMIVTDVERVSDHGGEYGALKIGLRYENRNKNMIMQSAGYIRTNFWGTPGSGGYSFDPDGNDVVSTVYYDLQKGENNKLHLKVGNPSYYLLGEYDLKLK